MKLVTDHAASSYNIPVLLIGNQAYGRKDITPNGVLAEDCVRYWLSDYNNRTDDDIVLGCRFLTVDPIYLLDAVRAWRKGGKKQFVW